MTLEKTEERKRSECRGDRERGREGGTFQRKKEKSEYTVQPRGKRGKESFCYVKYSVVHWFTFDLCANDIMWP